VAKKLDETMLLRPAQPKTVDCRDVEVADTRRVPAEGERPTRVDPCELLAENGPQASDDRLQVRTDFVEYQGARARSGWADHVGPYSAATRSRAVTILPPSPGTTSACSTS
jgi:hypothetical protein